MAQAVQVRGCSSAPTASTVAAAVISPSPSCTTACARCIVCAVKALHTQTRGRTRAERRRRRVRASVGGCSSRADRTTHEQTSPHLRLAPPPPHHDHHQHQHQHQHHDRSCSCSWHCHRSLLPPSCPRCVAITTLTQTRSRWRRCSASTCSGAVRGMGAGFDMSSLAGEAARRLPSSSGVACLSRPPPPDGSVPAAVALGYAECARLSFDRLCAWLCDEACPHLRMTSDSVFVERGQRLRHGQCVRGAGPLASRCAEEHRHRVRGGQRPHGHPGMLAERIPSQCQSLHARLSGCVELLQGDATQTSSAWMRMRCDCHARVFVHTRRCCSLRHHQRHHCLPSHSAEGSPKGTKRTVEGQAEDLLSTDPCTARTSR